ncbi:hypothetical protein GGF39_004106 [Coemansia sp. RSA 1721]|nr:hypothetical protein GGF39_004106 [Coemansia sp. RSA 1721]
MWHSTRLWRPLLTRSPLKTPCLASRITNATATRWTSINRRTLATVQPDVHTESTAHRDAAATSDNGHSALAHSIRVFLDSTRQNPRAGLKPDELIVKCPECSPGKPRRLAYSAHLNTNSGEFVCTSCFAQGPWEKYRELAARRTFQNTIPRSRSTDPPAPSIDENTLAGLRMNLEMHEEIFQKLTGHGVGQMRLSSDALRKYGVGLGFVDSTTPVVEDVQLLVDGADHVVPCLAFPRTTFRTNSFIEDAQHDTKTATASADSSSSSSSSSLADHGAHLFCAVQLRLIGCGSSDVEMYYPADDAQPGLFGFHLAATGDSYEVIVTSRELDAVAAYQATGIPAVSLPRGAYQLPLDAMRALERFERIYVWLDDDQQGAEAAQLIARKLGVDRCLIVRTRDGGHAGAKSAGEALAGGADLKRILDGSRPVQHDKVLSFAALRDAVRFEVTNPDLIRGVESTDLPGWNACFKGLRPGELTILSGATGCGKTTVISQMSLDFCKSGVSTLWGSFEIPNVRLATRMLSQFARRDITSSPQDIDFWSRKFENLPLYFLKFHGSTKPDTVLETMRHAVYAYDVKHIVIDNLQFMMSMQAKGIDKYDAQDAAIATFRQFATDENVHITVVAHLRKDSQQSSSSGEADINSIFGSAKVTQEADNVVILQRYGNSQSKTRCFNVLKNRFDGTLGKIYISYSPESMGFKEIPAPRQRKSIKVVRSSGKISDAEKRLAESMASEEAVPDNDDGDEDVPRAKTTAKSSSVSKQKAKAQPV